MNFRTLGRTGIRVSPLCLGTLNFGGATPPAESVRLIHKALDNGINFIDTADYYNAGQSESILAQALSGHRRERTILATKFHFPVSANPFDPPDQADPNNRGNSRRYILRAVEDSLRRLQTDWIDLYQIHRPDFEIPQDETLRALDDLVTQGKVRYIGSSTFPAWLVMEAIAISDRHGWARLISEQPPYNLLDRRIENELLPVARRYDLAVLPWSPLAMGLLAGRYGDAERFPDDSRAARIGSVYAERITPAAVARGNALKPVARRRNLTPGQLALLWVKDQPGVTSPIFGPRTEDQLDEALAVLNMSLDSDTAGELDEIYPPGSASADFFNTSGWMKTRL